MTDQTISTLRNPLDTRVGYQLRRASSLLMARLSERLAQLGLSPTEASILVLIEANDAPTQSDIGRVLAIKRANMAPLTSGLERKGLIQREAVDGRSHGLHLTERGVEVASAARDTMIAHEESHFGILDDEARSLLTSTLKGLWSER